jgi:hypothetical protein
VCPRNKRHISIKKKRHIGPMNPTRVGLNPSCGLLAPPSITCAGNRAGAWPWESVGSKLARGPSPRGPGRRRRSASGHRLSYTSKFQPRARVVFLSTGSVPHPPVLWRCSYVNSENRHAAKDVVHRKKTLRHTKYSYKTRCHFYDGRTNRLELKDTWQYYLLR